MVQDIILGVVLSVLPVVKGISDGTDTIYSALTGLTVKFLLMVVIIRICMFVYPRTLQLLEKSESHDLFLLGLVAMCIIMTIITEHILNSTEVGAFLSGVLLSSSPSASASMVYLFVLFYWFLLL